MRREGDSTASTAALCEFIVNVSTSTETSLCYAGWMISKKPREKCWGLYRKVSTTFVVPRTSVAVSVPFFRGVQKYLRRRHILDCVTRSAALGIVLAVHARA